jgi:hypothetical protein
MVGGGGGAGAGGGRPIVTRYKSIKETHLIDAAVSDSHNI